MFNKSIIIAFFLNIVFSTEESINYKIHSIDRNNMIFSILKYVLLFFIDFIYLNEQLIEFCFDPTWK